MNQNDQVNMDGQGLEIVTFVLGPAATNSYLLGISSEKRAVVIDPAWDGEIIHREAVQRDWKIQSIWLTHAHFDHFGGAAALASAYPAQTLPVALHPEDKPLWQSHGGAKFFGIPDFEPGPEPTVELVHGDLLSFGNYNFEVRHTPGHTMGHVAFLERQLGLMFCGDLIFQGSVGRTDLSGGDMDTLLRSLQREVMVLKDEVQLLSGHGPATTVGEERKRNPFLQHLG